MLIIKPGFNLTISRLFPASPCPKLGVLLHPVPVHRLKNIKTPSAQQIAGHDNRLVPLIVIERLALTVLVYDKSSRKLESIAGLLYTDGNSRRTAQIRNTMRFIMLLLLLDVNSLECECPSKRPHIPRSICRQKS